ncbi:MAG TPA: energy transducer TonB, partial [Candidatus Polarisedimenticolia bacterium]|nr:energy transducer TonB [Candidatus Polarisedimenticolia bacterium]
EEFLKWAHPEGEGCPSPADISIVETWDGGLRARYGIGCGASTRPLQGIFQVREKEGVWQIASGFEADAPRIDAALGAPPSGPAGEAPAGISPPPKNAGGGAPETPLDAVAPPAVRSEASPEYPEEAGRARLIGEAHIELLVEVAPDGAPLRARPLRGPDPDLGMRRAAMEAVMRWRFDPARLAGKPLTYFRSVDVTFSGLPPESRDWVHRALFRVEAVVSEDELVVDEALRRVRAGEAFEKVAAESVGSSAARGGDWGLVSAATLPAAVRRALHEARVGGLAGPVAAEGLHYLILKRGEVYYALKPRPGGDLTYQILHQKNAPEGDALKQAVERDIADYLAESRRQTYVNEAARLMGIRQSSAQVGQLEIRTDVLSDDEIKTLGQVVDSVVRTQEAFWSPLVALRPFNQQVLVYAWAREADHDRLHRMWQAGPGGPEPPAEPDRATSKTKLWSFIGEYLPASHILSVPCERMGGHLNVPILIHEGIHMLDYERVYAAGTVPSQWFEEGLATYFGFSQIGARLDIEPGDIRRSGTIVSGNVRLQFDPRTPLQEYLRKIRDDGPMPLRALLESGAGDPTWTGERTIRAYCASWTLVHFLLHGARGGHRAAFEEYARAEARGAGGYDTFVRLFGPDLASLEAAWHRYEEDL